MDDTPQVFRVVTGSSGGTVAWGVEWPDGRVTVHRTGDSHDYPTAGLAAMVIGGSTVQVEWLVPPHRMM